MYNPAPIREFVTDAILKRTAETIVNGRTQKSVVTLKNLRGKFKQKGQSELNANGLVVVHSKPTYTTWWSNEFQAGDILSIGGDDYQIEGLPENVELRSRYAVLILKKIEGGA